MSRKQSAFLSDLLADKGGESEAAPTRRPLAERENTLARLASGEVRQVTELRMDPARCRIWPGNGRYYAGLSEESCRDLIDAIIAEGGQKLPAIVRHIKGDPQHEYEVLAGTRRHWAISWLRSHNYPDMQFVAQVQDLSDEAAFRLADIENRARQDLSDLERARSYADALRAHYGGIQARMAERLRISKGWLAKLLAVAALPDEIVAAFPTPDAIKVKAAYEVAQAFDNGGRARDRLLSEAAAIVHEQQQRRRIAEPPIGAPDVIRRLLKQSKTEKARTPRQPILAQSGRPLISIMSDRSDGLTVRVHGGSGASDDEVMDRVRELLAAARLRRGLREQR